MPKRLLLSVLPLNLLLFASLSSSTAGAQTSPTIKWQPLIENSSVDTNQIFPAEILSLATRHIQVQSPRYLGDPNSVFGVSIVSTVPNARVRVSIKVDRLADESSFEATIPEANQQFEIWPTIRFDTRALARTRQSFPTTVMFTVSVDGQPYGEQSRTVQVRSVNDVPFLYRSRDGKFHDQSPLFAAFVNEGNPSIDRLLQEALRVNAVQSFAGYQGSPQDVLHEVFAVWNVLQRQGVKYSSITTPSGQSTTVYSQHVRFLDEAVQNSQANCVDGTVLFASILYKLGIYPLLVKIPGHMFLGFYTDAGRQQLSFLETTLIGNPGLNGFERGWTFMTTDGYLSSTSYRQFLSALQVGNARFQAAAPQIKAGTPDYMLLDIDVARKAGISAITRF